MTQGSGVVIDKRKGADVVTNEHVIRGADLITDPGRSDRD